MVRRAPPDQRGDLLAPLARGIGTVEGEYLKVVIQPWLAQQLRVGEGSLVGVNNANGKFTITRSATDDVPGSGDGAA